MLFDELEKLQPISYIGAGGGNYATAPRRRSAPPVFSRLEPLAIQKSAGLLNNARALSGSIPFISYWSWWRESNPQPADYKSAALPLSHTSMHP